MPVERSSNGAQAHFQFQLCPYVAASAENFGPPLLHKVNYSKFLNKQTHTNKNLNGDYEKRFSLGGSRIPSLPLLRLASSRAHSSCSLFLLHLFFFGLTNNQKTTKKKRTPFFPAAVTLCTAFATQCLLLGVLPCMFLTFLRMSSHFIFSSTFIYLLFHNRPLPSLKQNFKTQMNHMD